MVSVCRQPVSSCKQAASCQLNATGDWNEAENQGELDISIAGSAGSSFLVDVEGPKSFTFAPQDPNAAIAQAISQAGDYRVTLTAKQDDETCKPAVCGTMVRMQPPPPCFDSL